MFVTFVECHMRIRCLSDVIWGFTTSKRHTNVMCAIGFFKMSVMCKGTSFTTKERSRTPVRIAIKAFCLSQYSKSMSKINFVWVNR